MRVLAIPTDPEDRAEAHEDIKEFFGRFKEKEKQDNGVLVVPIAPDDREEAYEKAREYIRRFKEKEKGQQI